MGKRSSFERRAQDFYPTPLDAVAPLASHLEPCQFIEPCCGNMDLVSHLEGYGFECVWSSDIADGVDALLLDGREIPSAPIITNPPWSRLILHRMIEHFSRMRQTWLLFDADWPHTKQSADLMRFCHAIVPVGRVKWIPDSKHTGKDNCAWYRFEATEAQTIFHPREAWAERR